MPGRFCLGIMMTKKRGQYAIDGNPHKQVVMVRDLISIPILMLGIRE
jgi:hypothetical protein